MALSTKGKTDFSGCLGIYMTKKFLSVGQAFPGYQAYFKHSNAGSCVTDMIQADKKGSVVLGFLESALVTGSDWKNNKKIRKVIDATFKKIG